MSLKTNTIIQKYFFEYVRGHFEIKILKEK